MSTSDHGDRLLTSLAHARQRLDAAAEGSPEWEAAWGEVEELERNLAVLRDPGPRGPGGEMDGATEVVAFGPVALDDGRVVQGTLSGVPAIVAVLRQEVAALVGESGNHAEFVRGVDALAGRFGFVVERGIGAAGVSLFYVWQEPPT